MNNHDSPTEKAMRVHHWVLIGFLVIGGFFLITEHRAHALGWLPFILLAACPLMHLFMHKNHSGHGGDSGRDRQEPNQHNH
jgi:hypothetical protein